MRWCGGVSAVHLLKLTACTIISKPQNTGLLVNQKASYRRKQTQQTSRRAAGGRRIGVGWASGGQAGGLRGQSGAMGWQRSRSSPGAGEARWACDAGAVRGLRSVPVGRHGAGRSACRVAVRGLGPALAGRSSTNAAMKRSAFGAGGALGSAGLRRGQSLRMRPCFIRRPFSALRFCRL